MEIYLEALRSYADNMPEELGKVGDVCGQALPAYTIGIHSIKSSSANIGAKDLAAMAKEMEDLAKTGDLARVLAGNHKFIEAAKVLVADIKAWLKTL